MTTLAAELMTWSQWGIFAVYLVVMAVCVFSVMGWFRRQREMRDAVMRIDDAMKRAGRY